MLVLPCLPSANNGLGVGVLMEPPGASSSATPRRVEQMDDGFMGFLVIVGGVALSLYVWKELARGECLK